MAAGSSIKVEVESLKAAAPDSDALSSEPAATPRVLEPPTPPDEEQPETFAPANEPPLPDDPYASEDLPPDFWDAPAEPQGQVSVTQPAATPEPLEDDAQNVEAALQSLFPGRILSVETLEDEVEGLEPETEDDQT